MTGKDEELVELVLHLISRCCSKTLWDQESFASTLESMERLLSSSDGGGANPSVSIAAMSGEYTGETLLHKISDVDERSIPSGNDRNERVSALKQSLLLLLKFQADPNAKTVDDLGGNPGGFTALHNAAFYGSTAMVETLLEGGAHVDGARLVRAHVSASSDDGSVNGEEQPPTTIDGTAFNQENGGIQTPLHAACANGHLDTARLLVERGANVYLTSWNGLSSLHWAVLNGHVEVCRYLLEVDASKGSHMLSWADKDGRTPLSEAKKLRQAELISLLSPQ
eukprot:TRINITY_DN14849_c0_g1_i1.p1 TRINITY_DN14849_c0_g1~~TRINITY_DN14849_c0_g1_i1.p1  ORF type:complete len:281 (-),score=52.64 TRINITY_DN14849_c0_g1_i1:116-958(-)